VNDRRAQARLRRAGTILHDIDHSVGISSKPTPVDETTF
jgi:hypothetical protein